MKKRLTALLALCVVIVLALCGVSAQEALPQLREAKKTISAGGMAAGILADGTAVLFGENLPDVSAWTQLTAIAAGEMHVVGLRADGTVVAAGDNSLGQCDVNGWTEIVAIAAGKSHTVAVRADGTVLSAGDNTHGQCDVSAWTEIVAVAAGEGHTLGLRADGTVASAGLNVSRQCETAEWANVAAIAAGGLHSVGLRADGTLLYAGNAGNGISVCTGWADVTDVAVCDDLIAGLKADGRLLLCGKDSLGLGDTAAMWRDLVAVAGGQKYLVGLKADGTLVIAGPGGSMGDSVMATVPQWVVTPTPAVTPVPEATSTPVPEVTPTPVPEVTPTPEPAVLPEQTAQPEATPYVTPVPLPIWERVPGYEMPVADAEVAKGVELKFVGIINIPALDVRLPVQSTWSYEQLAYTPCRYAGSCYNDGFVIIAHRFDSHFAAIGSLTEGSLITFTDMNGNVFRYKVVGVETLRGDQTEELLSDDYAMSLMTCTLSSSQRIVVRCERK